MRLSFSERLSIPIDRFKAAFEADRITSTVEMLAEIGRNGGMGVSRTAFSNADCNARRRIREIIERDINVDLRVDAAGNIIAARHSLRPDLPCVMTGSHLDTVPNGGAFDGTAGVAAALEAFRVMDQLEIRTIHPFELIVFSAEEANSFGISTLGSRAFAGGLQPRDLERIRDPDGFPLQEALNRIGGDAATIDQAARPHGSVACFIELHIEQMPRLERAGRDIGVVAGITGIRRYRISLDGREGHCGTTEMDNRQDALCGAAEMVLEIEKAASGLKNTVATVGRLAVKPNVAGVIPSRVEMDVDTRSFSPAALDHIEKAIGVALARLQKERSIPASVEKLYRTDPQSFSPVVRRAVSSSAAALGLSTMECISMAGHDTAHMNKMTAAGMIFIPCRGGLSHCREEWTAAENLLKGAQCLLYTLLELDSSVTTQPNGINR